MKFPVKKVNNTLEDLEKIKQELCDFPNLYAKAFLKYFISPKLKMIYKHTQFEDTSSAIMSLKQFLTKTGINGTECEILKKIHPLLINFNSDSYSQYNEILNVILSFSKEDIEKSFEKIITHDIKGKFDIDLYPNDPIRFPSEGIKII